MPVWAWGRLPILGATLLPPSLALPRPPQNLSILPARLPACSGLLSPRVSRPAAACPAEEVLLDENAEARAHKFYMVAGSQESPDHRWVPGAGMCVRVYVCVCVCVFGKVGG